MFKQDRYKEGTKIQTETNIRISKCFEEWIKTNSHEKREVIVNGQLIIFLNDRFSKNLKLNTWNDRFKETFKVIIKYNFLTLIAKET